MSDNMASPATLAATVGMRKVSARLATMADSDARRALRRRNGYFGPLTRAEASRRALRDLTS